MPIRGLTHREASFPQIGSIRKGAPKEPNRPGKDLDHFRVEFDEQETETAAQFLSIYGAEPDELRILLPFDEVDRNFDAWQTAYVRGGLIHRCDGEWVDYEVDPSTGKAIVIDGVLQDGSGGVKACTLKTCEPTGRLNVMIADLWRLAYLTFKTGSKHDIMNIHRQLSGIREINGKLSGIPLVMRRRPYMISTPSPDSPSGRARREFWLVSIEADPLWVRSKLAQMRRDSIPGLIHAEGEEFPLLESGSTDAADLAKLEGIPPETPTETAGGMDATAQVKTAEKTPADIEGGLSPDKLKEFLWDIIEHYNLGAENQYPVAVREEVLKLIAGEFSITPQPDQSALDVMEWLFDNRDIMGQPEPVWYAIWRWMNIQVTSGGQLTIGRPEARPEMKRAWLRYVQGQGEDDKRERR
jgi:hypothetical protein